MLTLSHYCLLGQAYASPTLVNHRLQLYMLAYIYACLLACAAWPLIINTGNFIIRCKVKQFCNDVTWACIASTSIYGSRHGIRQVGSKKHDRTVITTERSYFHICLCIQLYTSGHHSIIIYTMLCSRGKSSFTRLNLPWPVRIVSASAFFVGYNNHNTQFRIVHCCNYIFHCSPMQASPIMPCISLVNIIELGSWTPLTCLWAI